MAKNWFSRYVKVAVVVLWFWGAISSFDKTPLVVMEGRQKSDYYLKIMEQVMLPFAEKKMPISWLYQQDNAPIHVSSESLHWFNEQHAWLLQWPARSPNLNPIENVCSWVSRKVYEGNKQFETTSELLEAVLRVWDQVPDSLISKLLLSMNSRLVEVLERGGAKSSY